MKSFLLLALLGMFFLEDAHAALQRMPQDIALPTQKVLEYEKIEDAVAADDNAILNDNAGAGASSSVTVSSFLSQPDLPRNIVVTPGGTTADVKAGNVVVSGTDAAGGLISETFAFLANASTAVTGSKAFKTVTSISFPQEDSPYEALWDVGWGNKLGLGHCLDTKAGVLKMFDGGAAADFDAVIAIDVDDLSGNTYTPAGATLPDGSLDYEVVYFQNYRCE